MQNSLIFHSGDSASVALTPASENAGKRKLHAVIDSDGCSTPFQAPFPNHIDSPHWHNPAESFQRMTKKVQLPLTISIPAKTNTTANVLPSPLSDNEPATPTAFYARPQNLCASTDIKLKSKFSSSYIVELLASEMMIVKEGVYRTMQEKLKGRCY